MVPDRQHLRNGGDLRSAAKSKLRGPQPSSWGHPSSVFILLFRKFSWQVNDTKEESWQNILDSNSSSALAQVFCYSEDLYGNLKYSQTAPLTVKTTDSWTPNWAVRLALDDPLTFPRKDKDWKWTPENNINHLRFPSKSPSRFTKRAQSEILGHHGTKASDSPHLSDGPVNHRRSEPGAEMICPQNAGRWDLGHRDRNTSNWAKASNVLNSFCILLR